MRAEAYVTPATLSARSRAWLDQVRERTRPHPDLQLDPPRCALLVVDMIQTFAAPTGRAWLPASRAITPRIATLLERWRTRGAPVVFARHAHQGPHELGMMGRFFSDWIRDGQPESELIPALAPRPHEPVLRKTTYDAFLGTPLDGWLRARGVEQVLITGVLTHMCVETTARSAFCRGYQVHVPADATASRTEALHLGSLVAMADSVAVVCDSEALP